MAETPEPADAADALAVALCHLQAEQARVRFGLPDPKVLVKSRSLRAGPRTTRNHETPVGIAGI
jgi:hypothetical protein